MGPHRAARRALAHLRGVQLAHVMGKQRSVAKRDGSSKNDGVVRNRSHTARMWSAAGAAVLVAIVAFVWAHHASSLPATDEMRSKSTLGAEVARGLDSDAPKVVHVSSPTKKRARKEGPAAAADSIDRINAQMHRMPTKRSTGGTEAEVTPDSPSRLVSADGRHCIDVEQHCENWAKAGECDVNPVWMNKKCNASCGLCGGGNQRKASPASSSKKCRDQNANCASWASDGGDAYCASS